MIPGRSRKSSIPPSPSIRSTMACFIALALAAASPCLRSALRSRPRGSSKPLRRRGRGLSAMNAPLPWMGWDGRVGLDLDADLGEGERGATRRKDEGAAAARLGGRGAGAVDMGWAGLGCVELGTVTASSCATASDASADASALPPRAPPPPRLGVPPPPPLQPRGSSVTASFASSPPPGVHVLSPENRRPLTSSFAAHAAYAAWRPARPRPLSRNRRPPLLSSYLSPL
ncbi:hypothetical protein PVAP13_4KG407401 [Panicum virgatum]|uniref:Uncharacterized protein n=1 Tax=Panicum virgatum TaxID=38727 RepID=A0A8T0TNT2_PANVG|nr:hypothetical protein PVAP13_4KG407401 [Panicum virgatum]